MSQLVKPERVKARITKYDFQIGLSRRVVLSYKFNVFKQMSISGFSVTENSVLASRKEKVQSS